MLKTGVHEKTLVTAAVTRRMPLPPELQNAPELLQSLQLFWQCYFQLRRGLNRQQSVMWRDVQYWCDTYALDTETAQACHLYVAKLDEVWLSLIPKKPGKGTDNGVRGGNKRG